MERDINNSGPETSETFRSRVTQHLIQAIQNDPEYPQYPPHCQEDYVWDRLNSLEDDDYLPLDLDAFSVFQHFIATRRPETKIIKVKKRPPSGAFYE